MGSLMFRNTKLRQFLHLSHVFLPLTDSPDPVEEKPFICRFYVAEYAYSRGSPSYDLGIV